MLKKVNWSILCLLVVLALGCVLRFVGLTRGGSDFVLPEQARTGVGEVYYQFHPDEETLVRAALKLSSPLEPPLTAYGMLPMYLARGVLEVVFLGTGGWIWRCRRSASEFFVRFGPWPQHFPV